MDMGPELKTSRAPPATRFICEGAIDGGYAAAMFALPKLLLIAVLALFGVVFVSRAGAQTVVRVLHYNIHRDVGGTDSNVASQPALAKVVNHLAPDVWAINELGGNSSTFNATTAHDTLVAFINANLTIFGANPQEGVNYFLYIGASIAGQADTFIKPAIVSRWPFLATQTYSDANAAAGYPAMRGLVSAQVNLPGAVELGVFTTHLKASSFSDTTATSNTNAQKRQAEAETDVGNLQSWLAAHTGDAAVMMGDWNETEEAGETDNWKAGAIGDTLPNGSVYHPVTTLRGAGFTDPLPLSIAGNRDTIDAASPNARFDYLFYRASHLTYLSGTVFDTKQINAAGQLAALNAANGTSFVAGDSASASDHLPVLEVFLVSPGTPYLSSQAATGLDSTTAALNAAINPNGFATTWRVELGTTTAYGLTSLSQTLAAGTANVNALLNVAGLAPGTVYHFRIVAQNSAGTSTGADQTFTTAAFLDSDGDGIPNGWETANALNPNLASDALLDADGDGVSNRDEYAAGTNPRDATSVFRIVSVARTVTNVEIAWPTVFGKRYQLQWRDSLSTGTWSVLQDNIAGTGGVWIATDSTTVQRFYRPVTLP